MNEFQTNSVNERKRLALEKKHFTLDLPSRKKSILSQVQVPHFSFLVLPRVYLKFDFFHHK